MTVMTDQKAAINAPRENMSSTRLMVALVCGVLWIGGIGSLVALLIGGSALRNPSATSAQRRVAVVLIVLGVAGLIATALSAMIVVLSGSPAPP